MAPQHSPAPQPPHEAAAHIPTRSLWITLAVIILLVIGVLFGVQLAHGNSDYVCSAAVTDSQQSACTNGSWSPWKNVDGTLVRTYTGTQTTVSFNGRVGGISCSHPSYTKDMASGTLTTQYAACEIVESGTATPDDAATGSGGVPANGNVAVTSQTEQSIATAASLASSTTETSGSYAAYEDAVDAALGTVSISAVPSIVRPGDTATISWTSNRAASCTVSGDNGDAWPATTYEQQTDADGNTAMVPVAPAALTGNETSSAIQRQTIYTLTCISERGRTMTAKATVTLLPTFHEE